MARWLERLAEYNYEVVHRPGLLHRNDDAISRYPVAPIAERTWLLVYRKDALKKLQGADAVLSEVVTWLRLMARHPQQEMQGKTFNLRYSPT